MLELLIQPSLLRFFFVGNYHHHHFTCGSILISTCFLISFDHFYFSTNFAISSKLSNLLAFHVHDILFCFCKKVVIVCLLFLILVIVSSFFLVSFTVYLSNYLLLVSFIFLCYAFIYYLIDFYTKMYHSLPSAYFRITTYVSRVLT